MKIIDNKALLLRVRDPNRVTALIPKSQQLPDNKVLVNWGLAEASSLTSGERNKDYGDPVENMTHIANIFNAITGHKIKPSEVPMFHIATKLARKKASPLKRDHYVDIMAYVGIAYECEVEEE